MYMLEYSTVYANIIPKTTVHTTLILFHYQHSLLPPYIITQYTISSE